MLSDLRKHPRFYLPSWLPASIGDLHGEVVDLSMGGARIQLTEPLRMGVTVSFRLTTPGGMMSASATVKWCQLSTLSFDTEQPDLYFAGLVFDDDVLAIGTFLDALIAANRAVAIVEARKAERYYITSPIYATYSDAFDARMIDLSVRGARIGTADPISVGTSVPFRFRITNGPTIEVRGTVVWCEPWDYRKGFDVGLSIGGVEPLLRAAITQLCTRAHARVDANSLGRKFDALHIPVSAGSISLAN
jgi:hypothetical protein